MEININSKELQKGLTKVSPVINPVSLMPIMSNVLFTTTAGYAKLTGSDLETTIETYVKCGCEEGQEFAVSAKMLLDLLKTLPNERLSLVIENGLLDIQSSKGSFQLPVIKGEYPKIIMDWKADEGITMQGFVLETVLKAAIGSVSQDELRPTMRGVCFDFKEEGTVFVATNGFTLQRYATKIPGSGKTIVVPTSVLNSVKGIKEKDVRITFNETNVMFRYQNGEMEDVVTGRLLEGTYPPYDKVIPQNLECSLVADVAELTEAIKRSVIFAPGDTKEVVINTAHMAVYASNRDFSTHSSTQVKMEVNDPRGREIRFNATYLLEVLKTAGDREVKIVFGSSSPAVLVYNKSAPGLTSLVMPLQG